MFLLAIIALFCELTFAFRLVDEVGTGGAFRINEQGFVGFLGDPAVLKRERANPGSPYTIDQPLLFEDVNARQTCPSMVGPVGDNLYYCVAREYGYCDRRSGTCFCNTGYSGIDCSSCESTHFQLGNLCYPKKLCPRDCSGSGICDYLTGECSCLPHRQGSDCSIQLCTIFHEFCEACSFAECLRCRSGSSINSDTQACEPCYRFDPRCSECDQTQCLQCSDPLLNSIRRSGARASDPKLPFDEYDRELSISLPFGTQDPDFFAEAEPFDIVSTLDQPLHEKAVECHQGLNLNASWTCFKSNISHVICGHSGTVGFSSPLYAVNESDGYVRIHVSRSGGGFGSLDLEYWLKHIDTDLSDVSSTASYTTSQKLYFSEGIVDLTFLVRIHDDVVHEPTERFQLVLRDLVSESGGASYSPQLSATVYIYDDDAYRTHYDFCTVSGEGHTQSIAGKTSYFVITAYSSLGRRQLVGGDDFFVQLEQERLLDQSVFREMGAIRGQVVDNGNGTYQCSYRVERQGFFTTRIYYLQRGGLLGQYFDDPFMKSISFSRKDPYINNQWEYGAITALSADYVTIRWTGMIESPVSGVVQLQIIADDNCRLWVDGVLLIDSWAIPASDGVSASTIMEMNTFYDVIIEYREAGGLAFAELYWSHNMTNGMEIIPSYSLFSKHELTRVSPSTVHVTSGDTNAIVTECFGNGLSHGVASAVSYFECCPRDEFGNLRTDADEFFLSSEWFSSFLDYTDTAVNESDPHALPVILSYNKLTSCFDGQFTPFVSGDYDLSVMFGTWWDSNDTSHVFGSPFSVSIVPSVMFGRTSIISGNYQVVTCGEPLVFMVTSYDVSGNLRGAYDDSNEIQAIATHSYQPIAVFANVSSFNNGSYSISIILTTSGEYQLSVLLRKGHIHNSPYRTVAHHSSSYGPNCVSWGSGLAESRSGFQSSFWVQLKDVFTNNVTRTSAVNETDIDCTLTSILHRTVFATHSQIGNGIIQFDYVPFESGLNNLTVLVNGEDVIGSYFDVIVADGVTKANSSFAEGNGLVTAIAGEVAYFSIYARDWKHNTRALTDQYPVQDKLDGNYTILLCRNESMFNESHSTFESYQFQRISSISSICVSGRATVTLNDILVGEYVVNTAGIWLLHILFSSALDNDTDSFDIIELNANHIRDSPFTVYVHPTYLMAEETIVKGVGMSHVIAGERSEIFIHAVDRFGNLLEDGGDEFHMTIEREAAFHKFSSVDIGHGSYTITYSIPVSGHYDITIFTLVRGLNATYYESVNPHRHGISVVDESMNFDWGVDSPLLNRQHEVMGYDLALRMANFSCDHFRVHWNGFLAPLVLREPIQVKLSSDRTSTSRLEIGLGSDAKTLSNLNLETTSSQSTANGLLKFDSISLVPIALYYFHGIEESFLNLTWSSISEQNRIIEQPHLFHFRNATHSKLTVFPNRVSPKHCTAEGVGLGLATAGETASFHVQVRDEFGNIQLIGGHTISVYGQGLSDKYFVGKAVDFFNGTYLVQYNVTTTGSYRIFVAVNGDIGTFGKGPLDLISSLRETEISKSPFLLKVIPTSPSSRYSSIHGQGSVSATAGLESKFSVYTRDKHDNPLTAILEEMSVSFEKLSSSSSSSSVMVNPTELSSSIIDHSNLFDGTFRAPYTEFSYVLTTAGQYLLHVFINGIELDGSPMTLTVGPSYPQTSLCVARGTGLISPASKQSSSILVTLYDRYENRITRGGTSLVVDIIGNVESIRRTIVSDLGNGEYLVGYSVSNSGPHLLSIMIPSPTNDSFIGGPGMARKLYSYPIITNYASLIMSGMDGPINFTSSQNQMSAEWVGYVKSPMSDWYSICVESGQEVSVFLRNVLLISSNHSLLQTCVVTDTMQHSWSQLDMSTHVSNTGGNWGTMHLDQNRMNDLRIVLSCHFTDAPCSIIVLWAGPSLPMQIIPRYFLHPPAEHIQGSPFPIFISDDN